MMSECGSPGTIAEADLAAPRVRVDTGGLTTHWLPWLECRAGTTRTWNPPTARVRQFAAKNGDF